eukprot:XP_781742.2 PREDICTED: ribonuclease P protein subunit p38 [Strongylocentrotus purpuratus]
MSTNIAPTIEKGAKTVRKSKGKGKTAKTITRSALTSPYAIEWPPLPSGVTPDILSEIQRTFQPLQCLLGKRRCKNRKQTKKRKAEMESNPERKEEEQRRSALRSQLAFGVNEVTRSLEKDQLQLVLVCRSAKPDLMTCHLPTLSATRGCPAMAVFHLSNTLSPLLNMKTVLAIGFKKPSNGANQDFAGIVSYVSGKCPAIKVPWMDLKHLPLEELAAELSKGVFSYQRNSVIDAAVKETQQGKKNESDTTSAATETSETDAGASEETVLKDSQREEEEPQQGTTERTDGNGLCRDGGSMMDENAGTTKERVGGTEDKLCQNEDSDDELEGTDRQPQATKKRKLSKISTSPGKDDTKSKRNKTAKMPFQSTSVMHVKIISKDLKGKKGKGKRGKKK